MTNKIHCDNHLECRLHKTKPYGCPNIRAYLGLKRRAKPILAFAFGKTEFSRDGAKAIVLANQNLDDGCALGQKYCVLADTNCTASRWPALNGRFQFAEKGGRIETLLQPLFLVARSVFVVACRGQALISSARESLEPGTPPHGEKSNQSRR